MLGLVLLILSRRLKVSYAFLDFDGQIVYGSIQIKYIMISNLFIYTYGAFVLTSWFWQWSIFLLYAKCTLEKKKTYNHNIISMNGKILSQYYQHEWVWKKKR